MTTGPTNAERVEALAQLLEIAQAVRRSMPRAELPLDSPAAHAATLAERERGASDIADQVVVVAALWTLIAGDQLFGLASLVRSRAVFAMFPVLRSVIEHSCGAIWVLDPDSTLSAEARCARAAVATERTNQELVGAAAHLGGRDSPAYKEHRQQMKDFRQSLVTRFPDGTDLSNGVVAGQHFMRPTEVMIHYGERWGTPREWQGIYEYLCATANHPTLAAEEFLVATKDGLRIDFDFDSLERFLRVALVPYLKALEHYAIYCGWDRSGLDALGDAAHSMFTEPLFI